MKKVKQTQVSTSALELADLTNQSLKAMGETLFSETLLAFCIDIDTPRSLAVWLMYKHGCHSQILDLEIDARNYGAAVFSFQRSIVNSYTRFRCDLNITSYLSKNVNLNTGIDKRATALDSFIAAESKCKITNKLFGTNLTDLEGDVLYIAKKIVRDVLGSFNISNLQSGCRWGSGVSYGRDALNSTVNAKITNILTVTPQASPYFRLAIKDDLHYLQVAADKLQFVSGSIVDFVPKNAKTDRTICIEPAGNMFLQLGAGSYIRKALHKAGIDLNSQFYNQRGAYVALKEQLCTLDLKSASDTISRALVEELLPEDYVSYLNAIRSPAYRCKDGTSFYEFYKWSSMGNGYTFELESLIFFAISKACMLLSHYRFNTPAPIEKNNLMIYGDDLIVPQSVAQLVINLLDKCGFETNVKKTHTNGLYYESCGKHYFDGKEVTPLYQKSAFDSIPEIINAHNRLYRYANRYSDTIMRKRVCGPIFRFSNRFPLFPRIPDTSSEDSGLLVEDIRSCDLTILSKKHAHRKVLNSQVLCLTVSTPCEEIYYTWHDALLAYSMRFNPIEPFNGFNVIRRRTYLKYSIKPVHIYSALAGDMNRSEQIFNIVRSNGYLRLSRKS